VIDKKNSGGSLPANPRPQQNTNSNIFTQKGRSKQPVIVDTPQGIRCVGYIKETESENFLWKEVTKSEHLFKNFDAWALQENVIPRLKKADVKRLVFDDVEEKITYIVCLDTFLKHGIKRDFGFGLQIFLRRKFWQKNQICNSQLSLDI
jgi:hypothetical protein